MNWALIVMSCFRLCTPQYAELYPTKEACIAKVPAKRWGVSEDMICVPVAKNSL